MVEVMDSSTDNCVVVKFAGMIKGEEYRGFLDAVDERLARPEEVNIVAELSELKFYGDLEAVKEDWHFGFHEFRKINRMAFVGDKKWIEVAMKLAGPFSRAEDRHFATGQMAEAIAWACSG